ncbi:hypothetical protein D3Z60_12125 [Lachnospiraceae bacterium]|jgi:uncharacterized protein (DUF697 family)|nr:hypothetical protein [Lachnospiraceae bacterium]
MMAGNNNDSLLKKKTASKLEKVFKKMACKDPKKAIHATALSSALIVAALPIGVDAWALRLCECLMLMSIYAHYDIELSQSAAESLLTAAFAQAVGESAAYAALEAADAAAILTGGTSLAICIPIAAGLIETVGWTTIKYIEGNGIAKAAIRSMEAVGGMADMARLADAVSGSAAVKAAETSVTDGKNGTISFRGTTYTLEDLHEASKKVESAEEKVKRYLGYLESDMGAGRDLSRNRINLKYAKEALARELKNYDTIKNYVKA